MNGFIADALLANYDVFGLRGDNVVQSPDGIVHRIDNGGSLYLRAHGKVKLFPAVDIPKLRSMRDPNVIPLSNPSIAQSTAGRVYHAITEYEMAKQAAELRAKLSVDDINNLVGSVEFPQDTGLTIRSALIGRRAFLCSRFNV